MPKRTITPEEFDIACNMMNSLTEILLAVGIVELRISKKDKEIFWDTEARGKIDPVELDKFSGLIDRHWMEIAQKEIG